MIGVHKKSTVNALRHAALLQRRVIELRQDDNENEIRYVLPSDDDLWVALCALTPISTTNRPLLDQQQTRTAHERE